MVLLLFNEEKALPLGKPMLILCMIVGLTGLLEFSSACLGSAWWTTIEWILQYQQVNVSWLQCWGQVLAIESSESACQPTFLGLPISDYSPQTAQAADTVGYGYY